MMKMMPILPINSSTFGQMDIDGVAPGVKMCELGSVSESNLLLSFQFFHFVVMWVVEILSMFMQVAQLTQFDDELYKVVGKRSEDEKDAEVSF